MGYRDRFRAEGVLSPNLTPLLDIVLQLIVFFMMLVHFGTRLEGASVEVKLPRTPSALPGADLPLERMVVSVDSTGKLVVDGAVLDEEAAGAWWADQAKKRKAGGEILGVGKVEGPATELATLVVVRADRDASCGAVRRVLAAAQEEGFARFSLVVLRRDRP